MMVLRFTLGVSFGLLCSNWKTALHRARFQLQMLIIEKLSKELKFGVWLDYLLSQMAWISSMSTGRKSTDLYLIKSTFSMRGNSMPSKFTLV